MLAERKKRVKWSLNPRGNFWSQDTSKFGQQMLERMGWKPGCGLGANEQGITEHIKVAYKSDKKCIGYKEHGDEWLEQQSQFENLLAELGSSHDTAAPNKGNESLELRSRQSRARVHYHKFTRGKDISTYSDKDLASILGVKKQCDIPDYSNVKARDNDMNTLIGKVDNLYGVTTVNGGNMNDYFIKKYKNIDDAAEEKQAESQCEKEEVGMEFGESVPEAQIGTKKKRNRNNNESSDTQGIFVDGQETKENNLVLNSDSENFSKCMKKKRKLKQEAKDGTQLLKDDEKIDERNTEQCSEKGAFNFEEKDNMIKQEHKRKKKKKQKENPDMEGREAEQKIDGNEMNDYRGSYSHYRTEKRKLDQEVKEHLLKEEEIMKQNGRSAEESNNKKDMYGCEVEDNKIKRKKNQEKYAESPDAAYGGEDETHTNDTLLNHDNVNGSNCKKKKRKLKQEVTERTEDEQRDQGKTGKSDFDKLDQEVKEHLLKEEDIMKQNGRSAEESNIKKDIYGCEVEDNKIKRKKKQEKYAESPDAAYGGEDETHTNDTLLNHDNVNGSNCKKKKRKLKQKVTERTEDEQTDQGKTGESDFDKLDQEVKEHLLKEEEIMKQNGRSAEESNIKNDIYGCEVEDNKIKRKKKQQEKYAESVDAAYGGEDETHTNDKLLNHDNVNSSNCKKKKRKLKQKVTERTEDEQTDQGKTGESDFDKLDQEVKEHLLKEEEIMKQNGRSAEESNIKNDICGCEVEDNKIKRKKKQQEKYAESVDAAYGGEDETHTNDTLLNDNVNSSNCKKKKRKLKQEVTERTEDEQRDQGKTGKSDFDSSLTICNRSKKKCAKNLLQENDESVYYQDIIPAGDLTTEKKYSSKELKKAKKSVHMDSEKVDHCEMEHNEIVEEEARKQKMKKRKYDKDGSTHNIQEQTLVQYNVEETDAESHNRKNCEEPSENVEDSNEARNNTKFKQDVCNSNIKNTAGANIRISDFEKIDVRLRKMKPSAFAQFVDPSLIRFRGSNLFSIPGYGCY